MDPGKHILVVGAGFAGGVVAERLARAGHRVRVVERRDHLGGNAFDEVDAHGVLVPRYGPHFFHTNIPAVEAYLSRFTAWRPYEHRVLASVGGRLYPFPINLDTLNALYGLDLDEDGARRHLAAVRVPIEPVLTAEDQCLASVGRDLYERFYLGYTRKQWGLEPHELSRGVAARIPVRADRDDRYFQDRFQAMPAEGYTRLFARMLDHPAIEVALGTPFDPAAPRPGTAHTVYTGPIDAYFGHRFGRLPYRSLRFEHEHRAGEPFHQPVAQVNYPDAHAFTRITEPKHATGQAHPGTTIIREYPLAEGDPYYPIPRPENHAQYRQYAALAAAERDVTFVGRLAQYSYLNMDQVVAAALAVADRLIARI